MVSCSRRFDCFSFSKIAGSLIPPGETKCEEIQLIIDHLVPFSLPAALLQRISLSHFFEQLQRKGDRLVWTAEHLSVCYHFSLGLISQEKKEEGYKHNQLAGFLVFSIDGTTNGGFQLLLRLIKTVRKSLFPSKNSAEQKRAVLFLKAISKCLVERVQAERKAKQTSDHLLLPFFFTEEMIDEITHLLLSCAMYSVSVQSIELIEAGSSIVRFTTLLNPTLVSKTVLETVRMALATENSPHMVQSSLKILHLFTDSLFHCAQRDGSSSETNDSSLISVDLLETLFNFAFQFLELINFNNDSTVNQWLLEFYNTILSNIVVFSCKNMPMHRRKFASELDAKIFSFLLEGTVEHWLFLLFEKLLDFLSDPPKVHRKFDPSQPLGSLSSSLYSPTFELIFQHVSIDLFDRLLQKLLDRVESSGSNKCLKWSQLIYTNACQARPARYFEMVIPFVESRVFALSSECPSFSDTRTEKSTRSLLQLCAVASLDWQNHQGFVKKLLDACFRSNSKKIHSSVREIVVLIMNSQLLPTLENMRIVNPDTWTLVGSDGKSGDGGALAERPESFWFRTYRKDDIKVEWREPAAKNIDDCLSLFHFIKVKMQDTISLIERGEFEGFSATKPDDVAALTKKQAYTILSDWLFEWTIGISPLFRFLPPTNNTKPWTSRLIDQEELINGDPETLLSLNGKLDFGYPEFSRFSGHDESLIPIERVRSIRAETADLIWLLHRKTFALFPEEQSFSLAISRAALSFVFPMHFFSTSRSNRYSKQFRWDLKQAYRLTPNRSRYLRCHKANHLFINRIAVFCLQDKLAKDLLRILVQYLLKSWLTPTIALSTILHNAPLLVKPSLNFLIPCLTERICKTDELKEGNAMPGAVGDAELVKSASIKGLGLLFFGKGKFFTRRIMEDTKLSLSLAHLLMHPAMDFQMESRIKMQFFKILETFQNTKARLFARIPLCSSLEQATVPITEKECLVYRRAVHQRNREKLTDLLDLFDSIIDKINSPTSKWTTRMVASNFLFPIVKVQIFLSQKATWTAHFLPAHELKQPHSIGALQTRFYCSIETIIKVSLKILQENEYAPLCNNIGQLLTDLLDKIITRSTSLLQKDVGNLRSALICSPTIGNDLDLKTIDQDNGMTGQQRYYDCALFLPRSQSALSSRYYFETELFYEQDVESLIVSTAKCYLLSSDKGELKKGKESNTEAFERIASLLLVFGPSKVSAALSHFFSVVFFHSSADQKAVIWETQLLPFLKAKCISESGESEDLENEVAAKLTSRFVSALSFQEESDSLVCQRIWTHGENSLLLFLEKTISSQTPANIQVWSNSFYFINMDPRRLSHLARAIFLPDQQRLTFSLNSVDSAALSAAKISFIRNFSSGINWRGYAMTLLQDQCQDGSFFFSSLLEKWKEWVDCEHDLVRNSLAQLFSKICFFEHPFDHSSFEFQQQMVGILIEHLREKLNSAFASLSDQPSAVDVLSYSGLKMVSDHFVTSQSEANAVSNHLELFFLFANRIVQRFIIAAPHQIIDVLFPLSLGFSFGDIKKPIKKAAKQLMKLITENLMLTRDMIHKILEIQWSWVRASNNHRHLKKTIARNSARLIRTHHFLYKDEDELKQMMVQHLGKLLIDSELEACKAVSRALYVLGPILSESAVASFAKNFLHVLLISSGEPVGRDPTKEEKLQRKAIGAIYGLSGLILGFPYDVPEWVPPALDTLSCLNTKSFQVNSVIKETLKVFWKTHQLSWDLHKDKFSPETLDNLRLLFSTPSYIV